MSKERKNKIIQIVVSIILFVIVLIIDTSFKLSFVLRLLLYLIPYISSSYDVYLEAFEGIKEGEIFDECFLMCIATIGALCIGFFPDSDTMFLEAVFVMFFK